MVAGILPEGLVAYHRPDRGPSHYVCAKCLQVRYIGSRIFLLDLCNRRWMKQFMLAYIVRIRRLFHSHLYFSRVAFLATLTHPPGL